MEYVKIKYSGSKIYLGIQIKAMQIIQFVYLQAIIIFF